jgi:hypothetical protein
MEERGKPHFLEGYYRRKFTAEKACQLPNILWLESFHTVQHTDRKSSYDLLITLPKDTSAAAPGTAAKPAAEKTADQERELVIEILYLDVKDPTGQSGGGASGSGKDEAEEDQDAAPAKR